MKLNRCFHCFSLYGPTDLRCPNAACKAFEAQRIDSKGDYTYFLKSGWHAVVQGVEIKAAFNSKGAAEAGIVVERARRARH